MSENASPNITLNGELSRVPHDDFACRHGMMGVPI